MAYDIGFTQRAGESRSTLAKASEYSDPPNINNTPCLEYSTPPLNKELHKDVHPYTHASF